ncbi:efflux RND transporter permease subunit [Botrimarina mediterranea]|uniref:Efflux pump membrane transporter BepE n=1 Tax=Botrimarina mediterranea TaxID=2528022 RepID=A0A518KAJ1_9BACT|nr:multidrug efflux RND transporter permease subunit [Botrimarina mediterranea]QDV74809.1 Efflux pump membrane transporter BepE [Botrimarina mediterranea]QDV79453.1 Efflux pump membrane transporter BepE [Planctomycetes bacterium K2D]
MLSKFFIERPVFANVIAVITMLIGAVALWNLPIEQYPEITPPTVRVSTSFPGANATTVADTVASPIEQQVNGVENMLYMQSTSSGDGSYSLTVTFEIGTNLDDAQVQVQNRVAIAEPQLPEDVRRQGVTVKKQSTNIILVVSLTSDDPSMDTLYLSNYASLRLRDELSRIQGVGEVTVFGTANYSMRVWLNPEKLKARGMTAQDVVLAMAEQNVQVAAGQIGQPPTPEGQQFQYSVTTQGRFSTVEQFENIIVKSGAGTRLVYLKDVADVELGSQSYDQFTEREGSPNANIGIYQLPGANALQVAEDVKKTMERIRRDFPDGMEYTVPLDTTLFVEASVHEVYKTLFEAGILVLAVILVFLQDWRAVLIPATTVPVTIIGAFAAMAMLGFSINMLTLFGLILAIGIVVDDAIVVVENAVHHIERGEPPKEATIRAMSEVLGPIMGITLVLLAVFIPASMLGGITGQLYRQFALTIAATAIVSAINAVSLKPAQCALWLRPVRKEKMFLFRWFEAVYSFFERIYLAIIKQLVKVTILGLLVFAMLVAGTAWWYTRLPTGFIPTEDQGYILMAVQLPDAASQERTRDVMAQIDEILAETEGIDSWITIGGLSIMDNSSAPNAGTVFASFTDFEERGEQGLSQDKIVGSIQMRLAGIREAVAFAVVPPAIRGLGVRGGFDMQVEDQGSVGLAALQSAAQAVVENANGQSALAGVRSSFRPGVPQLRVDIDRVKAQTLNVPLSNIFSTLQAYLGSAYVNDFNKFGRTYQVRVQAAKEFRLAADDIRKLEVRNKNGQMLPLGSLVSVHRTLGPQVINRYNLYPAATVTGEAAPGHSSGDALRIMEQLASQTMPVGVNYEWTGMAYQEKKVGGEAIFIFAIAILLVYLVLAAQYESWVLPIAVILVVPLGLLGAVAAVAIRGFDNNVYTQIGIVLIIALASKNAILIVEFARDLRRDGASIIDAAIRAAGMRFRPIIMTSFAFILGVTPLVFANGPGAAGQQALGTAVFGGMIAATILAVFFIPIFYVVFQRIDEYFRGAPVKPSESVTVGQTAPSH